MTRKILVPAAILAIVLTTALCVQAADEETLQRQSVLLEKGLLYEQEKNPQKAIAEYKKVIKIDRRTIVSAVAYHNLGTIYTDMGDFSQALDSFTKAIEINPELAESYAGRAYIYAEQGLSAEAIGDYTMTIKLKPEHRSAYGSRGVVFYNMGNNEEAIADIDRALKIDPEYGSKKLYLWRGRAYYSLGDLDQAVADYSVAIEANPEVAVIYNDRGVAYRNMGKDKLAVEDYKKAIELDPNGEYGRQARDNLKVLAELLREKLEKPKETGPPEGPKDTGRPAQKLAKKTQKTDEDELLRQQFTHLEKGRFYTAENNLDKAMKEFTKAIEINPRTHNAAKAYHNRGAIYAQMGNNSQALANYTKAIEINPDQDVSYYARGSIYFDEGDLPEALADLTKTIELDPDNAGAYHKRGAIYIFQEKYTEAMVDVDKVIEIEPGYDSGTPYGMRAIANLELGNFSQAVSDSTEFIKERPEDPFIYNVLGLAYLGLHKYEPAIKDFQKALELDPEGKEGKRARKNLEDVAQQLREELKKPKEQRLLGAQKETRPPESKKNTTNKITQEDLQKIDRLEKEWATNMDAAGQCVARKDLSSADKYLDRAMNAVVASKQLLTDKGLDLRKVPQFDAMEKLTVVYANLGEIFRLSDNRALLTMNINRLKQLAVQSYEYLEEAEAIFHAEQATGLANLCRQLKNELTKAFDAIEKKTGQKIR